LIDPVHLQAEADSFAWYHSIDLGNGVKTKGQSVMAEMVTEDLLPDFRDRSVLDIGAWDGYYSFLAERRGAARVVALDHYAWGVDFAARTQYWNECFQQGVLPDQTRDTTDFWRAELPGRRGFDLAHRALDSRVEAVVADFTTMDVSTLGTFDVVLYLGVLYHMKEPLTCLERVRAVTRDVAVIETVAAQVPGNTGRSLLELHAGGDLNADFGNWYVPTIEALSALAVASGFPRVDVQRGPPPVRTRSRVARRFHLVPASRPNPAAANYRAVIHARP